MSWATVPSFQVGPLVEFHFLSFMSVGTGFEVQLDGVSIKGITKPVHGFILGVPLLLKLYFKPGPNSMIEPYVGGFWNAVAIPPKGNIEPAPLSWRAGLQYGFKAGPGALFFDGGFTGDLPFFIKSKVAGRTYSRYNFHLGLGYKFGFLQRKIK